MAKKEPKRKVIGIVGDYDVVRETIGTDNSKIKMMPPVVLTTKPAK